MEIAIHCGNLGKLGLMSWEEAGHELSRLHITNKRSPTENRGYVLFDGAKESLKMLLDLIE
jgi:hypothetical protein